MSGDATINKNQFKFEFQNEKQNQTFEHHYDLPGIGLEPESAKLLTDRSFLDFESELLRTQLTANLKDLWRNQFCRVSAHDVEAAPYAESVLRCLNADLNPVPKFVDD